MIRRRGGWKAAIVGAAVALGGVAGLAVATPAAVDAEVTGDVEATPVTEAEFHDMESGTIWSADGSDGASSTRIRLAEHATLDSSWATLTFEGGSDLDITIFAYDSNDAYIPQSTGWQSLASGQYVYTIPDGAAKLAYVIKYRSAEPIDPAARDPWVQISAMPDIPPPDDSHVFPYPDSDLALVNHRGLSPGYPENTLAAFENAVARGVDAIEIDLRPTADDHVIILHDGTVDRTTDGTGAASDLTLAEIKALDAGSYAGPEFAGERIPTYEEALEAVQGTDVKLLLDMKSEAIVEQVVEITEAHGMSDQVIVGPRSVQSLTEFKAMNPDLRTLGFIPTPADADAFVEAGVDYIRLWPDWIAADVADPTCRADYAARLAAHDAGDRVTPGARSCQIEHLATLGVPVWSTTGGTGYSGMDETIRNGATGLLSDVPGVLGQLLDNIEAVRLVAGSERVAALSEAVTSLPAEVPAAATALESASGHLDVRSVAEACAALANAKSALEDTDLHQETTAPLVLDVERTRATLACARFPGTAPADTTAPTVTVKPSSTGKDGVYSEVSYKLFDEGRIDKAVLNGVEKDLTDNEWSDLNFIEPGVFGAVEGTNTLEVYDVAGNVTTEAFTLDTEAPTVTVKDGGRYTVGDDGVYKRVSFKLFDALEVDKAVVNGQVKDLSDNKWSDLNFIEPGVFGAVEGPNTLEVYDVAGNVTTESFTLDTKPRRTPPRTAPRGPNS